MSSNRPWIIAEIGFNHEGDPDLGARMIEAAAKAGADAVKFQTFRASDIVLPTSPHYQAVQAGEMDLEKHLFLARAAAGHGVEFLSTPFSRWAVDLLEEVGVKRYKIASMDLTNFDLLDYVGRKGKPLLVSTGMATLAEIAASVEFLTARGVADLTLLHCVSHYPCRAEDLNLEVMPFLRKVFGLRVGYSDHFPGVKACLMAALMGAEVIETHFTLDTSRPGGDHAHSADPETLEQLVADIDLLALMRGQVDTLKNRADRPEAGLYRRGIHAARELEAGEALERDGLLLSRPAADFGPADLSRLLGRKLKRTVSQFSALTWEDV
ncbi:MAG: N-acetylneuraminate synthase family protein [Thermodesulfobacteriota bacterium]